MLLFSIHNFVLHSFVLHTFVAHCLGSMPGINRACRKGYLRVGGFTCSRTQLVRAKNKIADNRISFFISEDYQLSV